MLSETKGGGSGFTTNLTYGRTDANGQPEIEQYKVGTAQVYVFDDPVTGQALGIITSADQDGLLVNDGLDNPVGMLTSGAGNSFVYTYDPWGTQTLTAGGTGQGAAQNPYAFHGGIKDPGSGLIKFGIRWYNPVTGTWTQEDTLDAPLDPANANRYAYSGDDPINNLDPGGNAKSSAGTYVERCLESAGVGVLIGLAGADETGVGLVATAAVGCAVGIGGQIADDVSSSEFGTRLVAIHDILDLLSLAIS